jgi:hypothetical protein
MPHTRSSKDSKFVLQKEIKMQPAKHDFGGNSPKPGQQGTAGKMQSVVLATLQNAKSVTAVSVGNMPTRTASGTDHSRPTSAAGVAKKISRDEGGGSLPTAQQVLTRARVELQFYKPPPAFQEQSSPTSLEIVTPVRQLATFINVVELGTEFQGHEVERGGKKYLCILASEVDACLLLLGNVNKQTAFQAMKTTRVVVQDTRSLDAAWLEFFKVEKKEEDSEEEVRDNNEGKAKKTKELPEGCKTCEGESKQPGDNHLSTGNQGFRLPSDKDSFGAKGGNKEHNNGSNEDFGESTQASPAAAVGRPGQSSAGSNRGGSLVLVEKSDMQHEEDLSMETRGEEDSKAQDSQQVQSQARQGERGQKLAQMSTKSEQDEGDNEEDAQDGNGGLDALIAGIASALEQQGQSDSANVCESA